MITTDTVADRIKNFIDAKGMNINSFAKSLNIHQPRIHRILNREIDSIDVALLFLICEKHDVDIDYFIKEDFKDIKQPVQKDEKLEKLINDFKAMWQDANSDRRGFLATRMEQILNEYNQLKREAGETDEAKTA